MNVSIEDLIVIDNEYCQLLPGLCGYRMDAESETEVFKELQEFKDSEYIPFDGSYEWHIFEGEPMNDSLPDGKRNIIFVTPLIPKRKAIIDDVRRRFSRA